MRIEPIARVTLADSVSDQLRKQIIGGGLRPGGRLPTERALCAAFGVGRTTIREALRGLAARGFVVRDGAALVACDPRTLPPPALDRAALAARDTLREVFEQPLFWQVFCGPVSVAARQCTQATARGDHARISAAL
jgi:DNA-binding FadR family transcriptional regulator